MKIINKSHIRKGKLIPWNKGLTKETDIRLRKKAEGHKKTLNDNPEIMINRGRAQSKTLKNNPEIGINRAKKRLQTYNDNPEIMIKQIKKRLQTLKNNPEIMINAMKKQSNTLANNPEIKIKQVMKMKKTLYNNPEIRINAIKKRAKTLDDNPEIIIRANKKHKRTLKNNPEIDINKEKKRVNTLDSNPQIRIESAKKGSATKQGIDIADWIGFTAREPYSQNWDDKFKRNIRKRDNQICMNCGIHREKLNKALHVHHVNYDKKLTVPQNCISLCNSCHAKTCVNRPYWTRLFQDKLSNIYRYEYKNNEVIVKLTPKE